MSRQTSVCDHRTGSQPDTGGVTHRVGDGEFVCLCVPAYTCVHPPVRLFNVLRDKQRASELELPQDPGVSTPAWLVIRICRGARRRWEVFPHGTIAPRTSARSCQR